MKHARPILIICFLVWSSAFGTEPASSVDADGNTVSAKLVKSDVGVSRDIYLAIRTDGKKGSGTKLDPFDCGGASAGVQAIKLNALLTTYQPNYTFHYEAGTYYTSGWLYKQRQTAGSRCKHFGAGIDKTIIKLMGAANSTADGVVFASDHDIRTDGFELHDLTIDCDATNQPKWTRGANRAVAGVSVHGSNMTISRIKVIHFGTHARGTECFPLSAWSYYLAGDFRNNVVEDCIISDPVRGNLDGISTLAVGGAGDTGIRVTQSNNVARRNRIIMDGTDAPYSHGPYAQLIEGNFIKGCSDGVYNEPPFGGPSLVVVRNNEFIDCRIGVNGSAHKQTLVDGYRIENNTFTDCDMAVSVSAVDSNIHYREVVVRGNRYRRTDSALNASGAIRIGSTAKVIVTENILDGTTSQAIHVTAKTSTVRENKTSKGASVD